MDDVFGRKEEGFGGAFDSSAATMSIGAIKDLLVTNVSVQYQQQLNRVFDIQTDATYYVIGRTQGNGTLGTVIGPKGAQNAGVADLGDVCNPKSILFNFAGAGCGPNRDESKATYKRTLTNVTLQSVGFTVQAADMLINENLGIQFGQLLSGDGTQAVA